MSIQLRSMAIASLEDFVQFMKNYSKGNNYEGEYKEGEFLLTPMLRIKLVEKDGLVVFKPPLEKTKEKIIFCLKSIVQQTHDFPRIEKELFPELVKSTQMFLLPVQWEEDHIQSLVQQVIEIFDINAIGPKMYISLYEKYSTLLNGQEEKDKNNFLETKAPLSDFATKMQDYSNLREEICDIRTAAMLNLYELDCHELNKDMSDRCLNLRNRYDFILQCDQIFEISI